MTTLLKAAYQYFKGIDRREAFAVGENGAWQYHGKIPESSDILEAMRKRAAEIPEFIMVGADAADNTIREYLAVGVATPERKEQFKIIAGMIGANRLVEATTSAGVVYLQVRGKELQQPSFAQALPLNVSIDTMNI